MAEKTKMKKKLSLEREVDLQRKIRHVENGKKLNPVSVRTERLMKAKLQGKNARRKIGDYLVHARMAMCGRDLKRKTDQHEEEVKRVMEEKEMVVEKTMAEKMKMKKKLSLEREADLQRKIRHVENGKKLNPVSVRTERLMKAKLQRKNANDNQKVSCTCKNGDVWTKPEKEDRPTRGGGKKGNGGKGNGGGKEDGGENENEEETKPGKGGRPAKKNTPCGKEDGGENENEE